MTGEQWTLLGTIVIVVLYYLLFIRIGRAFYDEVNRINKRVEDCDREEGDK